MSRLIKVNDSITQIRIDLSSTFCHSWPEISISVNGDILWQGLVESKLSFQSNFKIQENNQLLVKMTNKKNGPEIWDTEIDHHGNIVHDKLCKIDNLLLGGSSCNDFIFSLPYHFDDGTILEYGNGFLSQNGYFQINFPNELYTWIYRSRMTHAPKITKKRQESSRDYYQNFLAEYDQSEIHAMLDKINMMINKIENNQ